MTISINKEFTLASQIPAIKDKMKDFKSYFTEDDLLRMYTENTNIDVHGDIIKCTVSAFASNYVTNDASFSVEMIVDSLSSFQRIRFYIYETEGTYVFDPEELLTTHEHYSYSYTH